MYIELRLKLLPSLLDVKGHIYSLMNLPGHDRVCQTVPDAMHIVKDCVEKLVYLVIGNEKATHFFDCFSYINHREM